jgi:hypothetical protein
MSQLINPVGPEANNQRAEVFEDQVAEWAASLGWESRCRNVDLYTRTGDQSKGVDLLLAYDDPQLGNRLGIIGEAKIRHPLKPSGAREEVAMLAKKLAALGGSVHKLSIAKDIHATRTGLLVYDMQPCAPEWSANVLSPIQQQGLTRAEWPREVLVVGPDTLVGLADVVSRSAPSEFFWPPFDRQEGRWGRAAPPHQVVAGMLAYRSEDGTTTLWLRDPLQHDDDLEAIPTIVWDWRVNVDRIVCSSVSRDRWRTLADRWRAGLTQANTRDVGRVPESVEPRDLSFDSLTPFVDRWGQAA